MAMEEKAPAARALTQGETLFRAPWQEPNLFPPARLNDGRYGLWMEGSVEAISPEGLLQAIREEAPDSKKAPVIGLIEMPGQARLVSRFEVPALREPVLDQFEAHFEKAIHDQGLLFWILAPLIAAMGFFGINLWVLGIQVINSGESWWESLHFRRMLRRDPDAFLAYQAAQVRFQYWVGRVPWTRLWRSFAVLGLFAAVYGAQWWCGLESSVAAAGLVKGKVWEGQWWRLFSAPLMHGPVMHILMNGFSWYALATLMERVAHRNLVLPVFLITSLAGSVFSLFLLPGVSSLGASGGILGLLGFLTVLGLRRAKLLPPGFGPNLARSLAGLIVLGLAAWQVIDNAAHAGGYLAGCLLGLGFFPSRQGALPLPDRRNLKLLDALAGSALLVVALFTLGRLLRP